MNCGIHCLFILHFKFEINVTNDFDVELIENLGPERMRQDRLNILSDLLVARYRLSKEGVVELVCKIVCDASCCFAIYIYYYLPLFKNN